MIQDQALLLRAIPYRETSFIYHILTPHHGRLSLLARGIRNSKRRLQAELAPLHHLHVQWQQGRGEMVYLRDAERLQPLLPERYLLAGQTLLALAARLFHHNHDEHGYGELCAAMEALAARSDEATALAVAQWVLSRYIAKDINHIPCP
ncbi:MAG: DNA repair protein RecO [Mariprofundaceae bacterium]|nr:DNA repair protein RecO [Mariprofundaceae bacterium]